MSRLIEGKLDAKGLRAAIVVSRFNSFITDRLLEAAEDCLVRHGASAKDILVVKVPGAFELPPAVKLVAARADIDAVIALGAVIRGSTPHFDYVASTMSRGLASLALETGKVITFGVLTTDSIEQAIERAGTKAGNKGFDAAVTAIEMFNLTQAIRS
ncbi:MAG: 6,7-dimethyl-8-ribityllumazine synthase [Planctomycetota bacterium]|jgi:6,7-dimethyl-8-ribityllumazine synthase|nr:6,7-dimethyl-8-ribityllumazine synthase [Planctomycetota bacterium]